MILAFFFILIYNARAKYENPIEDDRGVRTPLKCEVCKYVASVIQERFENTSKIKDVLKIGSNLMDSDSYRNVKYELSELRFIEIVDKICDTILHYNVHKERRGSLRYAKGQSETMSTLHGLVNRGVKVELGIPLELWDQPSVEITMMKAQCEKMLEEKEEFIEAWYFSNNKIPIVEALCKNNYLSQIEQDCLAEVWTGKEKVTYDEEQAKSQAAIKEAKKGGASSKSKKSHKLQSSEQDSSDEKREEINFNTKNSPQQKSEL